MFYTPSHNRRKHWYHVLSIEKKMLWMPVGFCLFALVAVVALLIIYAIRAMDYNMNLVGQSLPGNILYDQAGKVVTPLSSRDNAPITWADLPQELIDAFIAREDDHFFEHGGVVYSALLRSAFNNIAAMSYKQGASTITMQLTRHVFELRGKTLDRKLLEIVLAQRIENQYDKKTILCQYLSRIYFGQNCYGLREAARFYFGKAVRELTLPECAMLAGIVRAPSLYNPVRNPELADRARRETLLRMRDLGFITPEQYTEAQRAPIPTKPRGSIVSSTANQNYPAMWANAELDNLDVVQAERSQGMAVLSHLHLPLQQYLERALAAALRVVEAPAPKLPADWDNMPGAEPNELQPKLFATAERPSGLRTNAQGKLRPGELRLQACALAIDSRLNHRGHILAIAGGRSAADAQNRWLTSVEPGRVAAPLVFCSACLPGGNSHHIVAHSARVTGSRLGYDAVHSFIAGLKLGELPDKQHENDLYDGLFPVRMIDLARTLFSLQNMGQGYDLRLINSIWSHGQHLIYTADLTKRAEYIRRESAVAVSHLPPFHYREGTPIVLNEELPGNKGQWSMVCNDRGVAVFVWMGVEDASGHTCETPSQLRKLISQASLALARQLHTHARNLLRGMPPVRKQ